MNQLEYLTGLIDQAQKSAKALTGLVEPLSLAQLNWKPDATTWSAGEVVHHIITSNEAYFRKLEEQVPIGKKAGKEAEFSSGWFGKTFIKRMEPGAPKAKTFKVFEPTASDYQLDILQQFRDNQAKLKEWIEKCQGKDLKKVKIPSPLTGLIRFRLGDALNILVTHQRRHLAQARRLTEHPDFPKI